MILDPGPDDVRHLRDLGWEADDIAAGIPEPEHQGLSTRFVAGGGFVLDAPATPPAIWGSSGDVLWSDGEALMIVGPQGVGKTTVAWQLVKARLGLQREVLGFPVVPGEGRVLYMAMDRPAQASRAAARLFTEEHRDALNQGLAVHRGPPPYDLAKNPTILTAMCKEAEADTVIIDSLKDAAIGLSEDPVGSGYNRARQAAITNGVQVVELHHNRKSSTTNGAEPNTIADVYGSVWLTSGAGSIISLYGNPGDPVVSLRHLKQPMNEVGPYQLSHDHTTGRTTIHYTADLVAMVRATGPEGLTAKAAAIAIFDTKKPTEAETAKARRKLDSLAKAGLLTEVAGQKGGVAKASVWYPGATA